MVTQVRLFIAVALFLTFMGAETSQASPFYDVGARVAARQSALHLKQNPQLEALKSAWSERAKACFDSTATPAEFVAKKAVLQSILKRLIEDSNLEKFATNAYGACVDLVPDATGMFASFSRSPRLNDGVIEFPIGFLDQIQTEDELAFILAHEFSHHLLMHEVEHTQRRIDGKVGFSFESEADKLALRMIVNAGYDVMSGFDLVIKLRGPKNLMHPAGVEMEKMRADVLSELNPKDLEKILQRLPTPL